MRKVFIILFSVLLAIGIAGTFWGTDIARAAQLLWDSCPNGLTNDPYPGACRLYLDTNNDRICDRSQSAPQSNSSTGSTTATTPANNSPVVTTPAPAVTGSQTSPAATDTGGTGKADTGKSRYTYYFVPILAGLIVLYSFTWILSARKIIATLLHRKIWNMVLLVSALISALLGIVLLINIEFGTRITMPFNMLFWHVEAGIALSVVAIFHIIWHWSYFAKILGMKKT